MSLAGQAVVAIWNGIAPEGRTEFYEWHNREHMPERVGIPGFRRGRRYIAKYGTPEFFTLYEADSAEVLVGQDYLNRLNNPTPWTQRVPPTFFRDTVARHLPGEALARRRAGRLDADAALRRRAEGARRSLRNICATPRCRRSPISCR